MLKFKYKTFLGKNYTQVRKTIGLILKIDTSINMIFISVGSQAN